MSSAVHLFLPSLQDDSGPPCWAGFRGAGPLRAGRGWGTLPGVSVVVCPQRCVSAGNQATAAGRSRGPPRPRKARTSAKRPAGPGPGAPRPRLSSQVCPSEGPLSTSSLTVPSRVSAPGVPIRGRACQPAAGTVCPPEPSGPHHHLPAGPPLGRRPGVACGSQLEKGWEPRPAQAMLPCLLGVAAGAWPAPRPFQGLLSILQSPPLMPPRPPQLRKDGNARPS